jgi:hypothetical protein
MECQATRLRAAFFAKLLAVEESPDRADPDHNTTAGKALLDFVQGQIRPSCYKRMKRRAPSMVNQNSEVPFLSSSARKCFKQLDYQGFSIGVDHQSAL